MPARPRRCQCGRAIGKLPGDASWATPRRLGRQFAQKQWPAMAKNAYFDKQMKRVGVSAEPRVSKTMAQGPKNRSSSRSTPTGASTTPAPALTVTLEDLAGMVKNGEDFIVYDAKTGEGHHPPRCSPRSSSSRRTRAGQNLLPITFLRQLIPLLRGDSMQMLVPRYPRSVDRIAHPRAGEVSPADEQRLRRRPVRSARGPGAAEHGKCSSAAFAMFMAVSARRESTECRERKRRRPASGGRDLTISSASSKRCRSASRSFGDIKP